MSKKDKQDDLESCRTAADFERYAKKRGAKVVSGGKHRCIEHNGYRVPLGHSKGELPIGTRRSIIRTLRNIGLGILLLAALVGYLYISWG